MKKIMAACAAVLWFTATFSLSAADIELPSPQVPPAAGSDSQKRKQPDTDIQTLGTVAEQLAADVFWDPASGQCLLAKNGHFLQFRKDDQLALFDFRTLKIIDAPKLNTDGALCLTQSAVSVIRDFFNTQPAQPVYKVGAVLIDPGHGGRDSGAVGRHTVRGKTIKCVEKDVVLDVSTRLFTMLKKAYPGKKIVLTRTGDTYPSLEDRVEIANNLELAPNEAVLYVSVHANASFKKDASGFEVWYLSQDYRRKLISEEEAESREIAGILNTMMEEEFTTESILIAKFIMDEMNKQIGSQSVNRGIKEESWFVVRNVHMPSVLIELGFVSNPREAELLTTPSYLQKAATGIYNGLVTFINYFENSKGFTSAE